MGPVEVPRDAKYAAQTQRAVENFPISGLTIEPRLIRALALIKSEAAAVNATLKDVPKVDRRIAAAIVAAADEVAEGRWDAEFPIDVYQTGSGTSSNMNANEVIATLATEKLGEPVHPNDHVNASQSSNDVFPSAIQLAATEGIARDLIPALEHLEASLRRKQRAFAKVVKSGRTHLMDATPVTLGQEFGGYASQIHQAIERLDDTLPRIGELPLGGTAVGTGINAPKTFARKVIARLVERTGGLPLTEAKDHFAAQSARDAVVETSGELRTLAVALIKIANDTAVAFGGTQGAFELNVFMPMMARNLLESIRLLTNVSVVFADKCIDGITANEARLKTYAESSPSIGTSLNPYIGYEKAGEIIKASMKTGKSIRELVLAEGLMTEAELDKALDVIAMTKGGII
jgi:fumarate hydratase class II